MKKLFSGLVEYMKDPKNLLVHGIIGVAILFAAVFLPVSTWIRVVFLVIVVGFNIIRMTIEKKGKTAGVTVPIEETPLDKRDSQ